DQEKISLRSAGRVPIYEPGLEEMVRRNFADQRLIFTTDLPSAVKNSQVICIAVGTPQCANGHADLQYVEATARGIARAMDSFKIVVTKSTVPVGTADRIKQWMAEETRQPFAVASNPEFMKEGAAVEDFMKPDRVVLGGDNEQALETLKELYDPFLRTGNPILVMDSRSAEMSKYAANAMLATKISFINEIACLCEALDADVSEVRRAISLDRRIGPHFIFPGVGYGGSCFPKDIRAMIGMAGGEPGMPLLRAVEQVNERQKGLLFAKVKKHFGELAGLTLAVWGLAFKPRAVDHRDRSALARGRAGAGLRSRGDGRGAKNFRRPHPVHAPQLRRAARRLRADDFDRMERISPSRFRAHPGTAETAGDFRRPQHLRSDRSA